MQPLILTNLPAAGAVESGRPAANPTLSSLIVSLSVAALMLSLTMAAVFCLIVWVVGR